MKIRQKLAPKEATRVSFFDIENRRQQGNKFLGNKQL